VQSAPAANDIPEPSITWLPARAVIVPDPQEFAMLGIGAMLRAEGNMFVKKTLVSAFVLGLTKRIRRVAGVLNGTEFVGNDGLMTGVTIAKAYS
jgi:hypothetical protein